MLCIHVVRHPHHLQRIHLIAAKHRRVRLSRQVVVGRRDLCVAHSENHLHRGHEHPLGDERGFHLGPERGERGRHRLHERLIGAGRSLRDDEVRRTRREQITVESARRERQPVVPRMMIVMRRVEVQVVLPVRRVEKRNAAGRCVRAARIRAAARRPRGSRGISEDGLRPHIHLERPVAVALAIRFRVFDGLELRVRRKIEP